MWDRGGGLRRRPGRTLCGLALAGVVLGRAGVAAAQPTTGAAQFTFVNGVLVPGDAFSYTIQGPVLDAPLQGLGTVDATGQFGVGGLPPGGGYSATMAPTTIPP